MSLIGVKATGLAGGGGMLLLHFFESIIKDTLH